MDRLERALLDTLRREGLFGRGERLLLGCSGGMDSVALAMILTRLAEHEGWSVTLGHVDHRLRTDSAADADFVAALGATLGLETLVSTLETAPGGSSPEAAAREARYQALTQLAARCEASALVLAHHADDQLETVLYRLAKGSATPGLLGIPRVRPLAPGLRVVRPFLATPRAEIEAYARRQELQWREDPTNRDTRVPRNLLRHRVVPSLRELNPGLTRTLAGNLEVLAGEDDCLDALGREALARFERVSGPGVLGWDLAGFASQHVALQRRMLVLAYLRVRGDRRGLTREVLERARLALLAGQSRGQDVVSGLRVLASRGIAWLYDRQGAPPAPVPARLDAPCPVPWAGVLDVVAWPAVMDDPHAAFFDPSLLEGDVVWRRSAPAQDRFTAHGHAHDHPLERFLAKARVPIPLRDRLVVLALGRDVLWLPGFGRSNRSMVPAGASSALRARWHGQAWFDKAGTATLP